MSVRSNISRTLRRLAIVVEAVVGFVFSIPRRLVWWRKAAVEIHVFNALVHPQGVYIHGRALAEKKLQPPREEDGRWINFKRTVSQFVTAESPRARIEVRLGDAVHKLRTDRQGYFQIELPPTKFDVFTAVAVESGWCEEFALRGATTQPKRIIISDVDDTLIETGATAVRTMIATTVFGNALTRQVVHGMADLLRDLRGDGSQPLFAITSSPWNLEGFLKAIFYRVDLPVDGVFMTDWGLTVDQWIHPDHDVHKLGAIRLLMSWYAGSSVVLFGDDSQLDPEVFTQVATQFPGRVEGIFIRPVSGTARKREVLELLAEAEIETGAICRCGATTDEIRRLIA